MAVPRKKKTKKTLSPRLKLKSRYIFAGVLLVGAIATVWTLRTFAASPVNSQFWPATVAPQVAATTTDARSLEVGIRFVPNANGTIKSVRFYKGAGNTGTHTAALWDSAGKKLGTATFTGETATGWQQANFKTAIKVQADAVYTASYHAPKGHYSYDENYFTKTIVSGDLTAPGATPAGVYTTGTGLPTTTYQKRNFWVDVVFARAAAPAQPSSAPAAWATMNHTDYDLTAVNAQSYPKTTFTDTIAGATATMQTASTCATAWGKETRSPSVDWSRSNFMCWNKADFTGGWIPQGITGSGSAGSAEPAAANELVMASWYTAGAPTGLAAPTSDTTPTVTADRLSLIDAGTHKYRNIELARPCATAVNQLCRLGSHAGGVAWAGSYIYLANTSGLFVFNTNDLYLVGGQPVLVATEKWTLNTTTSSGQPSHVVSSVSFDNNASPAQLVTVDYRDNASVFNSKVMRWNLDATNHLDPATAPVSAAAMFTLPSRSLQGIASWNGSLLATDTNGTVGSKTNIETLFKWRDPQDAPDIYRLPSQNSESLYVDSARQKLWVINELAPTSGKYPDTRFVFSIPTSELSN